MNSYTSVIDEYVEEFVKDPDDVSRVVIETAEKFRDDYYEIVDVVEDEFDKGELEEFYKEVREAIREALIDNELL